MLELANLAGDSLDDVRAWPSVEPAIDFTSTGTLAFALFSGR
jgi:hypothetical protein